MTDKAIKEIQQWAVDVLDKNAPLPFSANVRRQLLGSGVLVTRQIKIDISDLLMEPAAPWIDPPKSGFSSNDAANKNHSDNYVRAAQNALKLNALQEEERVYQKAQAELEVSLQQIDSDFRKNTADTLGN